MPDNYCLYLTDKFTKNKDEYALKYKKYMEKNKDKLECNGKEYKNKYSLEYGADIFECACGLMFLHKTRKQHLKSKRHQILLSVLGILNEISKV
jgi:predicted house-cleaning noncanonical NTP pyrophosphatase (MazG superfamily)